MLTIPRRFASFCRSAVLPLCLAYLSPKIQHHLLPSRDTHTHTHTHTHIGLVLHWLPSAINICATENDLFSSVADLGPTS
jgi:hypothetical protein